LAGVVSDSNAGGIGLYDHTARCPKSDGAGINGTYTRHLLANMVVPGLKVEDVFKRVRAAIRQETNGQQIPWENTSLEGDFYFVPPSGATHPVAAPLSAPLLSAPAASQGAPQVPPPPAAYPSRIKTVSELARCFHILHRVALGEPLSAEDETTLRRECK